jgi:hypothetical protein
LSESGGEKEKVALLLVVVAVIDFTGPGIPGVTVFDADFSPGPSAFVPYTLHEYSTPLVRPVMTMGLEGPMTVLPGCPGATHVAV